LLIVGLGNPGSVYKYTRHNIGFMLIDRLCLFSDNPLIFKKYFLNLYTLLNIDNSKILLLKPQGFMNYSGKSILKIVNFFKLKLQDIIIVYDDIYLKLGRIKIQVSGGHGGHNGLRSIIDIFGKNFIRIKIGIGIVPDFVKNKSYVLQNFTKKELFIVNAKLLETCNAINCIVKNGLEATQRQYNKKHC
jgi:PTH1 family peptidyl-tRNA hydrolase